MAIMRFGLVEVASRAFETKTWGKLLRECTRLFTPVKVKRSDIAHETRWEATLKKEREEAHSLCRFAIRRLVPLAGHYQLHLLDTVQQAAGVYDPEVAESVYREGNEKIEAINSHIAGILYNARKMRAASRRSDKEPDAHAKAALFHTSVLPYIEALRLHADRLNELIQPV